VQWLSDVLILVPSHHGIDMMAKPCLDYARQFGASIIESFGVTDIGLHRCMIAQKAMRALQDHPELQYVLWYDDDMVVTPWHVDVLRAASSALGVSVTAHYCKHTSTRRLTARSFPGFGSYLYWTHDGTVSELVPVVCGMGALLVRRQDFIAAWDRSPAFCTHTTDDIELRAIAASGPAPDVDGVLGWISEDQVYCTALWQYASGVYAVPLPVGHVSKVALYPTPDAAYLDEEPGEWTQGLRATSS